MPNINIDHAQTNLRWCKRAWNDGEMHDLALFLFRKALSQMVMEDISEDTQVEIIASCMGKQVCNDMFAYNTEITESPSLYSGWQSRIACLLVC